MNRTTGIIALVLFLLGNIIIFIGLSQYFLNTTGTLFPAILYYAFVLGGSILFFSLMIFYMLLTKWLEGKK
jgi:hypothetical protein